VDYLSMAKDGTCGDGRTAEETLVEYERLLSLCDGLDTGTRETMLASGKQEVRCAFGKREEEATAEEYLDVFLPGVERRDCFGDALGLPVVMETTIDERVLAFTREAEKLSPRFVKVTVVLRGQPDLVVPDRGIVCEIKNRTVKATGKKMANPCRHDLIQAAAYGWICSGMEMAQRKQLPFRPILVEKYACSSPHVLVATDATLPADLETEVRARLVRLASLAACCSHRPCFRKKLELLSAESRNKWLRDYLSGTRQEA
jgi:hypothetical protein